MLTNPVGVSHIKQDMTIRSSTCIYASRLYGIPLHASRRWGTRKTNSAVEGSSNLVTWISFGEMFANLRRTSFPAPPDRSARPTSTDATHALVPHVLVSRAKLDEDIPGSGKHYCIPCGFSSSPLNAYFSQTSRRCS